MLPYQSTDHSDAPRQVVMIGVGGAGANIIHCFGNPSQTNVQMVTMSLDDRLALSSPHIHYVQLGAKTNRGLGSGGDPAVGADAAQESEADIIQTIKGKDLVVLVTGLGGGTGSGAAPVIARIAKDLGVFLVVIATMPFHFEGRRRQSQAEISLRELLAYSQVLLCFENDHMESLIADGQGVHEAFALSDQLLAKATASVPTMALSPGLINLGIDELMSIMKDKNSRCVFGAASARGENRALRVAERTLESPMLSYKNVLSHVDSAIVHISGGESLSLSEIETVMATLHAKLPDNVNIFFGAAIKTKLDDEIRVTFLSSIDKNADLKESEKPSEAASEETIEGIVEEEAALFAIPDDFSSEKSRLDDELPTFEPRSAASVSIPSAVAQQTTPSSSAKVEEPTQEVANTLPLSDVIEEIADQEADLDEMPHFELDASEEESLFAPIPSIQKELGLDSPSKGKFSNLAPTLIDGEDLDLPPYMRQKRSLDGE